jgi:hypothetical protein
LINKYKLLNNILVAFLFILIISNYKDLDFLYSFGDSFFLFDTNVKLQNILSVWDQSYNFGSINTRNQFSFILIFLIKNIVLEKISFIIFQKIYILIVFLVSFVGIISFYNICKKEFLEKTTQNIFFPDYFYVCIFFFLHPFILQYAINVDFSGFISILSTPIIGVVYYKFIKNFNYKYLIILILSIFYFYSAFNNILIIFAIHLVIVPFFFILFFQLKLRPFLIRNSFYFFIILFLNLPFIYYSLIGIINLGEKEFINTNYNWLKWMSTNSSFFNIIQGQNYVGFSEEPFSMRTIWSFYDYIKVNLFGKLFYYFYILGFVFYILFNNYHKYQKKIIVIFLLFFIILSKGIHFPFSFFNEWLYNNFFILQAYRTIFYLYLPLIPFLVLLPLFFIKFFLFNLKNKNMKIFMFSYIIINISILLNLYYSYYNKNFISRFMKIKIPIELLSVTKNINSLDNQRLVLLPFFSEYSIKKIWKLHVNGNIYHHFIDKEIITNQSSNTNVQILNNIFNNNLSKENILNIFKFYGISHIFFTKDNSDVFYDKYYLETIPINTTKLINRHKKIYHDKYNELYFIENNSIIDIVEKIIVY